MNSKQKVNLNTIFQKDNHNFIASTKKGFTLVELIIVMAIIGILATLGLTSFRSTQARGRDAQRKSDLRQIANALELINSDYNIYPPGSSGNIQACDYDATPETCTWGDDAMQDVAGTVYFRELPGDPLASQGRQYYYRTVLGSGNQEYQLYAALENTKDNDCLGGDCESPPTLPAGVDCGEACNFAVTSANTIATQE